MYKLLALDLDGTLIDAGQPIIAEAKEAIAQAAARGVTVTIATGRTFQSARQIAGELGLEMPLICYHGAMVRHSATGATIFHEPLPLELARQFTAAIQERNHPLTSYVNDIVYVKEMNAEIEAYCELENISAEVVGDLLDFINSEERRPTKLLAITSVEEAPRLLEAMQARFSPQLYVTRSYPTFTEALNPACNKGRALAALAASLNIPAEQVMAIGDNLNDLPMIEWAGMGVAVANAVGAVRNAAKYVATAEVGEGVAEAIHKFLLD